MSTKVLIIDDEPGVLESIADVLSDEGYESLTAATADRGLEIFATHTPDLVFLDIWLPDQDGLEVLRALLDSNPAAKVVMMSGHGTVSTAVKAIKLGAGFLDVSNPKCKVWSCWILTGSLVDGDVLLAQNWHSSCLRTKHLL